MLPRIRPKLISRVKNLTLISQDPFATLRCEPIETAALAEGEPTDPRPQGANISDGARLSKARCVCGERRLELRDSDVGLELPERLESKRRIRQRGSARSIEC
jgi:hypothetical protein